MPLLRYPTPVLLLLMLVWSSCEPPQPHVIGFAQCTMGDAWRQAMVQEMERELAFHDGVELVVRDAQNNSALQVRQIDELLREGIDLLIVSPNEAEPVAPAIARASQQGIPVIVIDRKTTTPRYTTYIGADNYAIGFTAGEYLAQLLDGKGTLLEITGLPGSSPAMDRGQGFKDAIAQYPDLQLIASINGQWLQDTAVQALAPFAERLGTVNAVFAHNDPMALGAYQVSRANGMDTLKIVGVDGLAAPGAGLDLVLYDTLDATLLYPTGGSEAIKAATQLLAGNVVPRTIHLESTLIDDRNVEVMRQQADRVLRQQADIERQQMKLADQQRLFRNQRSLLAVVLLLLLVVTGLGVSMLRQLRNKQRINQELAAKNDEILQQRNQIAEMAEKTQAAQEAKIRLFTNISHEFRTPLSLILAPVEELLELEVPPPVLVHQNAHLIRANALRLLRLVTQLMDFRRMEHAKMRLHAAEHNVVAFVQEVMDAFAPFAKRQQVDFRLNVLSDEVRLWYDAHLLDKVLFNLYANAFKFLSPDRLGRIYTTISTVEDAVVIRVADNGKGMTEEESSRIFERFYSGAQEQGRSGTGLGLALSRELIHLHGGTITVRSKLGEGTQFEVRLPLGDAHLADEDKQPAEVDYTLASSRAEWVEAAALTWEVASGMGEGVSEEIVLIIEDNAELRAFLERQFAAHYQVVTAADGAAGWKEALEHIPDVIVCDVMLPEMSGLEVVQALKRDIKTSHIPVLLLTAQGTVEQQIQGLALGAEDYLAKPFHMGVLLERVRALLRHRNVLRSRYLSAMPALATSDHSPKGQEEGGAALDRQFVNAFQAVVEEHLGDATLQVDTIAQALGLSRMQLYRKVKAMLGYTVGDYIKHVRLKRAAALLRESEESIANIAYAVGFTSPAYFSTAFKAKYELSPSEFRAQGRH